MAVNQQQLSQLLTLLNALHAAQAAYYASSLIYSAKSAAYSAASVAYDVAFTTNANADAVQADTELSLKGAVDALGPDPGFDQADTVISFADNVLAAHQAANNAPGALAAAAAAKAAALAAYLTAQQDLAVKDAAQTAAWLALQAFVDSLN